LDVLPGGVETVIPAASPLEETVEQVLRESGLWVGGSSTGRTCPRDRERDSGYGGGRLTGCAVAGERPLSGAVTEVTLDGGQLVIVKGDTAPARCGPRRRGCAGWRTPGRSACPPCAERTINGWFTSTSAPARRVREPPSVRS